MRILFFCLLTVGLLPVAVIGQTKTLKKANTIAINASDSKEEIIRKAAHVIPTSAQLAALRNEFIAFIHFGPNTFTRLEWGSGKEDPAIFDLKSLDTDQWCAAMKAAGMKMVIITAKHHDGFVLWQSRYTTHGMMSSGYKNGNGDIVKELAASCKKYGLKLGIYLSPADLFQIESATGLYGNLSQYTTRTIPRAVPGRPFNNKTKFSFKVDDYNEYFLNQLFELLTEYGPISEVWFDGAHPKRKGNQQYNYHAWRKLIRTLAPNAVVFGKEDIRWCGNEAGATRPSEWNIIPYEQDPATMNNFADLMAPTLGERDDLYKGKFLHYQQAETNTSIREGWFYRDDSTQKVRSVDDIFDIYERSVGGNSTFLLNIPPNREGRFSPADSAALYETGKRIKETYGRNLFEGAAAPKQLLDRNDATYLSMPKTGEIIISTAKPVTINRIVLQEAVATHSERVEKHAVDAWIDHAWKEIVHSTNIGYKRILRFPETTASKFRIRIIQSRLEPAIATISAHYYETRPPQLGFSMDKEGMVTIAPVLQDFGWNAHGQNASANLNTGYTIYYTIDGSEPGSQSIRYEGPFTLKGREVKAVAIDRRSTGVVSSKVFGIIKRDWKLVEASSERDRRAAANAFDANAGTYWQTRDSVGTHFISIDLGTVYQLKGFAYTPQTRNSEGMMERGTIRLSSDGKNWTKADDFYFGNLVNDPTSRTHYFKAGLTARYIRIEATAIAGNGQSLAIAELDFFEQ
jgi:alpha-L-fucosidase